MTDPALLTRAAHGDADAQAQMVNATLQLIADGETSFPEGVRGAEWWARLAAVHGRQQDRMILAGVLMYAAQAAVDEGEVGRSIVYQAESIAVLNELADEGHEDAARHLQSICDVLPPESTLLAADVDRATRKALA